MIFLISPAKTFKETTHSINQHPIFIDDAKKHAQRLSRLSIEAIMKHMNVSEKIAHEVKTYYSEFGQSQSMAIFTYDGYQYKSLSPHTLNSTELNRLNERVYIISGLYGLIRPFDSISFYRLEMKDKTLKDLYHYWTPQFIKYFKSYHQDDVIIDLLSSEYRKAFLPINRICIDFYQLKAGRKISRSMEVKKMRGLFLRHVMKENINDLSSIKNIQIEGYHFDQVESTSNHFYYVKKED